MDGGITDNLGLRGMYEVVGLTAGANAYYKRNKRSVPRHLVATSVDASTNPVPTMDMSDKQPSLLETISAMSNEQ